ncbi:MAG: hypothetical protein U1G07_20285 [Verrucomicrobiota bacterium]
MMNRREFLGQGTTWITGSAALLATGVSVAGAGLSKNAPMRQSLAQRLQVLRGKRGGVNLVGPVVYHSIQRIAAGEKKLTDLEQVIQSRIGLKQADLFGVAAILGRWTKVDPKLLQAYFGTERAFSLPLDSGFSFPDLAQNLSGMEPNHPPKVSNLAALFPLLIAGRPQLGGRLIIRNGAAIVLEGRLFGDDPAQVRVQFFSAAGDTGDGPAGSILDVEAAVDSVIDGEIRLHLPSFRWTGPYLVRVSVDGRTSNVIRAYSGASLPDDVPFEGLEPAQAYPGDTVVMRGESFDASLRAVAESPADRGLDPQPLVVYVRNEREAYFSVPDNMWPGDYFVRVRRGDTDFGTARAFRVKAPHYRAKLACNHSNASRHVPIYVLKGVAVDGEGYERHERTSAMTPDWRKSNHHQVSPVEQGRGTAQPHAQLE